jgi:iron complex outermembrane receptor protein
VLATAGGGNIDQGNVGARYGGGNGNGLDYRVYGKAFTRGPEFHPDGKQFDDWRMGQGGFRLDWDSGRRDSVTLQGDLYDGLTGQRSSISSYTAPFAVNAEGNVEVSGGNVLAKWRRAFADGSDVQVQSYYNYTHRLELGFGEDRHTFDVDFIHHLKAGARNDVIWGLGANVATSDTIQTVSTVVFVPAQQTDRFASAFAQDQIALVPNRLFVTLGSKLLNNNYTGTELEPNARLLWTPSIGQSIWVAATRAVRTPSDIEENVQLTQFIIPGVYLRLQGNPAFVSEKLNGYEAGYRGLFGPNVSMDVAIFYNNYNDVFSAELGGLKLETTPGPAHLVAPLVFGNGLVGNTSGFELNSAWTPVSQWRVNGSYSFLHMDMGTKATSVDTTSAAMDNGSSPHHQVVVRSALNLPWRLEFDQTYRYVSALSALSIDAYHTADLRGSWHANDSLELSLVGQNLLQPHHVEFNGDPATLVGIDRSVYVKATWRR